MLFPAGSFAGFGRQRRACVRRACSSSCSPPTCVASARTAVSSSSRSRPAGSRETWVVSDGSATAAAQSSSGDCHIVERGAALLVDVGSALLHGRLGAAGASAGSSAPRLGQLLPELLRRVARGAAPRLGLRATVPSRRTSAVMPTVTTIHFRSWAPARWYSAPLRDWYDSAASCLAPGPPVPGGAFTGEADSDRGKELAGT